jgi:hypothetical protein
LEALVFRWLEIKEVFTWMEYMLLLELKFLDLVKSQIDCGISPYNLSELKFSERGSVRRPIPSGVQEIDAIHQVLTLA